ncbi:MAG: type III pantothenate kinase [Nitrospirae bacterium]|nr:MAG: type III pantothenate kinase [Nitrospirota bacterium]
MLLTIDIGNSHIVWGVFERQILKGSWRLSTDSTKTSDEYGILFLSLLSTLGLDASCIHGTILSSVVPPVTPILEQMVRTFFHHSPLVVTHEFPLGIQVCYANPQEIGTDRLVNAVAAYDRYRTNLTIVDFGTATTFCAVTHEGKYLGGAIAPGLKSSVEALHSQTAKLPIVELVCPKQVIGTDTTSSMQAGLIFGYTGLVDELVTRIQREVGKGMVLATGGLASVIAPISRTIQEVRPFLTLEGLELLYRRLYP